MRVKAYICLPTEELVVDIGAQNPGAYREILSELSGIRQELKTRDFSIYYDSENVKSFRSAGESFFQNELPSLNRILGEVLGRNSIDVNLPTLRKPTFVYGNWRSNIPVEWASYILSESAESVKLDTSTERTVCICLGVLNHKQKTDVHIISDSCKYSDAPEVTTIPLIESVNSFVRWKNLIEEGETFSLENNARFVPLDKFWKKERIYKEVATGNHWYFDYFHRENKIHFEVFDSTGDTHLGEADEKGNLNVSKADDKKKISNFL